MIRSIIEKALESKDALLAKQALQEIDTCLRSSSDQEEKLYLLFSRANCYIALGAFDEARRALDVALRARPDDTSQTTFEWTHALIAQQEEKYCEAFEKFSTVLTTYSEQLKRPELRFLYDDIQTRRGFLLVTLRRFQDAIPLLRESLSFDLTKDERSDVLSNLGLCYAELNEYESARDYFLQSSSLGLTNEWKWRGHLYLGIAYYYTDMLTEAKAEFGSCEELAASHALPITDVYAWLATTCKRLGQASEAARYARLSKRN